MTVSVGGWYFLFYKIPHPFSSVDVTSCVIFEVDDINEVN